MSEWEEVSRPTESIRMAQPYHITLTKNAKGVYQWEISVHEETPEKVFETVQGLDAKLRVEYGGTQ
jgi:hypothetical protein